MNGGTKRHKRKGDKNGSEFNEIQSKRYRYLMDRYPSNSWWITSGAIELNAFLVVVAGFGLALPHLRVLVEIRFELGPLDSGSITWIAGSGSAAL